MEKAEFESILSQRGIVSNDHVEVLFTHNEENDSVVVTIERKDVPDHASRGSASCLLSSDEDPEIVERNIASMIDHLDEMFRGLNEMTSDQIVRLKNLLQNQKRQINRK